MPASSKYPEEIRRRAVRMVWEWREARGDPRGGCAEIGRQLGVNKETLRNWVRRAASSLEAPAATANQNRCRCSRRATGGRPGDRIGGRPVAFAAHPAGLPIATPHHRGVATTG